MPHKDLPYGAPAMDQLITAVSAYERGDRYQRVGVSIRR